VVRRYHHAGAEQVLDARSEKGLVRDAVRAAVLDLVSRGAVVEAIRHYVVVEVPALDGKKLGDVQSKLEEARKELAKTGNKDLRAAYERLSEEEWMVHESSITGDRKTLVADSLIPAAMAVIYLLLFIYFKAIGGYKPVHIATDFTGGTEGPMEA